MRSRTILITNYHTPATTALIRDFKTIGFRVVSPDSDWGRISYFASNSGLGSEIISEADYRELAPGWVLITCKPQEHDLTAIAAEHGDRTILNIAQQNLLYDDSTADVMICPDIGTFEGFSAKFTESLLYFPRPYTEKMPGKDLERSFSGKTARSFVSMPHYWPDGTQALTEFRAAYPHPCEAFGYETSGGHLDAESCLQRMAESYVTLSFKESEAYGLSCLESMLAGTPVASLGRFMSGKTLGRYFLDDTTAILADTVAELVERLTSLSIEEYRSLSETGRARVLDLTSDERTVDRLKAAIDRVTD